MAKNDKKAPSADAPDTTPSESAAEATSDDIGTPLTNPDGSPRSDAEIAELFGNPVPTDPPAESPAHAGMVVSGPPAGTMTQAQLNGASDLSTQITQYENKLGELEGQILSVGDKYPEWLEGLVEAMSRYGMSNTDEAFDVSVSAPLTYIRLRHG